MNYLDFVLWLSADTEKDKADVWRRATHQSTTLHYTNCYYIKWFWRSPIGQLVNFWYWIYYAVRAIPRNLATLKWRIGWEYRLRRRKRKY